MVRLEGCSDKTNKEINKVLRFLDRTDISERDREAAELGLNDWFFESILDEIHSITDKNCHY